MSTPRTPAVAQRLVDAYLTGLRQRLPTLCLRRLDRLPGAAEAQLQRLQRTYPAAPAELLYLLQRVNGSYWESIHSSSERPQASTSPSSTAPSHCDRNSSTAPSSGGGATSQLTSMTRAAAQFLRASLDGPNNKPVNHRRIAVPILGSALGTCPYYLKSTEDILHPTQQPFPPLLTSAPRQPESADAEEEEEAEQLLTSSTAADGGMPPLTNSDNTFFSSSIDVAALPSATSIYNYYKDKRTYIITLPLTVDGKLCTAEKLTQPWASHRSAKATGEGTDEFDPAAPPPIDIDPQCIHSDLDRIRQASIHELAAAPEAAEISTLTATFDSTSKCKTRLPRRAYVDPRIDIYADFTQWLAFADSMFPHHPVPPFVKPPSASGDVYASKVGDQHDSDNALGDEDEEEIPKGWRYSVSRLYVDFAPNEVSGGASGQVIQYSRKPEAFRVVAKDFGDFLKFLMTEDYNFTKELEDEDEDEDDDVVTGGEAQSGLVRK